MKTVLLVDFWFAQLLCQIPKKAKKCFTHEVYMWKLRNKVKKAFKEGIGDSWESISYFQAV